MNLLQLEYFMTLARLGSFRKTAEYFFVSQPMVSKQISLLEKELGIPLFNRGYRTVALTPAGKIMFDALGRSRDIFDDAVYRAKLSSQPDIIELCLGFPECSDFANLSNILSSFQQEHSDVALKVRVSPISQLLLDYPDSKYDMVINHERNLRNKCELEVRPLAKRKHVAVISRHHPRYRAQDTAFEDLKDESVYVPAPEGTTLTKDYLAYICAHHGFICHDVIPLPNLESVLLAVKMCFGIAVLDDLINLPPDFELDTVPTNVSFEVLLAWHKENRNPAIPLLSDMVLEQLNLPSTY